jgi:hypothetical protein
MSSKRLSSLSDYARHGYKLRLDCACGRTVLADPHAVLRLCHERGWRHTLEGLALKLRCSKCGKRPKRIGPALGGRQLGGFEPQIAVIPLTTPLRTSTPKDILPFSKRLCWP